MANLLASAGAEYSGAFELSLRLAEVSVVGKDQSERVSLTEHQERQLPVAIVHYLGDRYDSKVCTVNEINNHAIR